MPTTGDLADFVLDVRYERLSDDVVTELKKRVLDTVGIGMAALDEEGVRAVTRTVTDLEASGSCRLWGRDASASPPQAAMHNTALTRSLDFMDSFLAPGETPHPSDTVASVLACGEAVDASGRDLLEGVGVAYEVQAELAWNAPVRDRGFDHVTHTVVSAACGAGKVLGLDREKLRNAIGIAGTAHNALRVTRTGGINEWKGVASANAARNAVYACLLAANGMEGPVDLFEGQKGWNQVVAGTDFDVDLDPACERVFDTMTKRYVAETYAQSAVEAVIELAETENLDPDDVAAIDLDTFHGAKLIIGGGEGDRHEVSTKAQADHSLPYMLAAALVDRELTRAQYDPERIRRSDVQTLLRTVTVQEDERLTEEFENGTMPAVLTVELDDGTTYRAEKDAFQGHPTQPMSWADVVEKFETVTETVFGSQRRHAIVETVRNLDDHDADGLLALLE